MQQIANWLRQAAPYINSHRGKTFIIKVSGQVLENPSVWESVSYDIALLHSLGIKIVLVFGARPQINAALTKANITTQFDGISRITPDDAMPILQQAIGSLRFSVESAFSKGTPDSPLHGANVKICSGNFVIAKPVGVLNGYDYQHTGVVRRIETEAINAITQNNAIALLSPLGVSITGHAFNLNAEHIAVNTAAALKAEKLIFIGEDIALKQSNNELLRECDSEMLTQLLAEDAADNAYLSSAKLALEKSVKRIHLLNAHQQGALIQELFTRDGSGTLITQTPFEQIRPAKIADISAIIALIKPLEQKGILVKRAREQLESEINNFFVMTRDQVVIGCAALYPLDADSAEIACVAIHPDYQANDRGERLLLQLEKQAKAESRSLLYVLTTQTEHWFIEQGFAPTKINELPKTKQMLYNYDRNSKVLKKHV